MRKAVSTIRRRSPWTLLALLGSTLIVPLTLAGVARSPHRASRAIRAHRAQREAQLEILRSRRTIVDELENQAVAERLSGLLDDLSLSVPEATDEVRLFYLVRLLCAALGIELEALALGPPEGLGLVIDGEDIAQRLISVRGSGTLGRLVELVEALRIAGLPLAIREVRATDKDSRFGTRPMGEQPQRLSVTLALYERQRVSPSPTGSTD